jgi:hypothetical protein
MTNREDAWVDAMQTPGIDVTVDSASRVAERSRQLAYRDDPVLSLRKSRELPMSSRGVLRPFVPHTGANDRSA